MNLMHMVIDWTAMGYKFGDTAQIFYEAHKDEMNFTDDQIKFIYEIFQHLQHYKDGAVK